MNCDNPGVRVVLENENIDIPTVNYGCETRINNEGPLSINRISEVHYPFVWGPDETDFASKIHALNPEEQNSYDLVTIYYQEKFSRKMVPCHRGYIRYSGGSQTEGTGRFFVLGPSSFLPAISASKSFDEPNVSTVLEYVAEQITEHTPFTCEVGSADRYVIGGEQSDAEQLGEDTADTFEGDDPIEAAGDFVGDYGRVLGRFFKPKTYSGLFNDDQIKTSRNFKKNSHSLKDITDWITNVSGGQLYFSNSKPLRLIYDSDGSENRHFDAVGEKQFESPKNLTKSGSYSPPSNNHVDVITNDSLVEISPTNQITVNGESNWSIDGHPVAFLSSKKFPSVEVTVPKLKERAGGTTVSRLWSSNDKTIEAAERTAKDRLRKLIQNGQGDILAFSRPDIEPGDTISAVPSCEGISKTELPKITFEVVGVRHRKSALPKDGHKFAGVTYITVVMNISESDMVVTKSKMEDL